MKKTIFKGAGCAIVTPFNEDGTVNYEKFTEMIEFQIANNTDAIIVMGTTGEASTLYDADHIAVTDYCVKVVNGRVPVIAGCGANHTHHAIALSKAAEKSGADGLLHVTPYYNKTSQRGLIEHYKAIAESTSLPIILYNVPGRTGMTIQPSTYYELSKIENIVATKEASGNLETLIRTHALCGDDLPMYSGNDDQTAVIMSLGGLGVISVLSNIVPDRIHNLCQAHIDGRYDECLKMQADLLELNDAIFCDVNPIPVKEALNQMGYEVGPCSMPLYETSDANKERINITLKKYNLI